MDWTNRSFLLDIKPNGCFANLFVTCPEGEQRDLIRILKDGVELSSNNNNNNNTVSDDILDHIIDSVSNCMSPSDSQQQQHPSPSSSVDNDDHHHRSSLKATVDGLIFCPDTVTNYAWADDHQTFSCKLKVERYDECYFSPRSLKATLKILTGGLTLDQYCKQLEGCEIEISCRECCVGLLTDTAKITRCFQSPSSNYSEVADDWFCCCSHGHGGAANHNHSSSNSIDYSNNSQSCSQLPSSASSNNNNKLRLRTPGPEYCYIGDSNFLVDRSVVENVCIASSAESAARFPILTCAGCQNQLGNLETAAGDCNRNNTVRFYHSAVLLKRKCVDDPRSYLETRLRTRERYFAWLLLSECEQQSSLKFALKTLDNHPALLVWLLDSYSIMVNGYLSDESNVAPFKPFPILKMLYKKLGDNDKSDPRVTGEDGSVGHLSLPGQTCEELMNFLVKSTTSLPSACRAVGQFSVGYIRMASSL